MIRDMIKDSIRKSINESVLIPKVLYRGIEGKYSSTYQQDITWVSTDEEYAKSYTKGNGEVLKFTFTSPPNILDLGFRTADTEVQFSDIVDRLQQRLSEYFRNGKITKEKAFQIMDILDEMNFSGHKKVYMWMQAKPLIEIYKMMQVDAILQREGNPHSGNVITFGVINKLKLRRIL